MMLCSLRHMKIGLAYPLIRYITVDGSYVTLYELILFSLEILTVVATSFDSWQNGRYEITDKKFFQYHEFQEQQELENSINLHIFPACNAVQIFFFLILNYS